MMNAAKLWEELGREYQNQLWDVFNGRCQVQRIYAATGLKKPGSNIAAKIAMMAMTTSNSIKVKSRLANYTTTPFHRKLDLCILS